MLVRKTQVFRGIFPALFNNLSILKFDGESMAYREDTFCYGENGKYIEHEIKWAGKYGAKGEKRAPRKKATPEQIRRQNQWNKEKLVLRLIRTNFHRGDLWITLKFPKGTRMKGKELKEIRKDFLLELRKAYRKRGSELKYICRLEIGKRGGPHIHMIINALPGQPGTADMIQEIWEKYGKYLYFTPLYEDGDFKQLAVYITKPLEKEQIEGQLTLFGDEEDRKIFSAYSHSKNLVLPEQETHRYKRRTVRKLVQEGPKPAPGYYIDRDSIRYGINPYTGMSYYYYTEIRLREGPEEDWKEGGGG